MKQMHFVLVALLALLVLAACAPQTVEVEVTREVEVVEEVEVTREVEVVEEVEVTREVEVVQEVEVIVDPTACNMPVPAEETTIRYIGWPFPITEFYTDEFKKCNDVENVTVDVQLLNNTSVQEQVRLDLSTGGTSAYSVIHITPTFMYDFANEGWLRPLDDLVEKYYDEYNLGDIPESAWEVASFDGHIYGIPFVANTLHLFYRSDIFEEYGLEVPTTYDEVIDACEVLKDDPNLDIPFVINLHAGWAWEIEFLHFFGAAGGQGYLNEDLTPAFNGPEGVAALEKMQEVIGACMGNEGITYSVDDTEIAMETGGIAFTNTWASRAPGMYDPEKSFFVDEIMFAPAPALTEGGPLAGSAWIDLLLIPAETEADPEVIFQAIMESVDERSQAEAAEYGLVPRISASESRFAGPYVAAASATVANGVGFYQPTAAVELARTALGNWLPLTATGELTPQEALDKAAEEYLNEATAQGFID